MFHSVAIAMQRILRRVQEPRWRVPRPAVSQALLRAAELARRQLVVGCPARLRRGAHPSHCDRSCMENIQSHARSLLHIVEAHNCLHRSSCDMEVCRKGRHVRSRRGHKIASLSASILRLWCMYTLMSDRCVHSDGPPFNLSHLSLRSQ